MALTDTACKNAKGQAKPYKLADERGLFLIVNPSGSKWWRLRVYFRGKENMLSLGVYPDVGLKDARERRDEARKLIAAGIDPAAQRQQEKQEAATAAANSFAAITAEWLGNQLLAASTRDKLERRLERDILPYLGKRPIAEIKPAELLAVLRRIEERSVDTAHRALTECGQILRYAVRTGRLESDITRDLRGALKKIDRQHFAAITDAREVGPLMRAIWSYGGTAEVRSALRLTPLLFQRPGEIRHMQWNEIDLEAAEWRYFVTKTKSWHVVPLPRQAIAILRELEPLTGQGIPGKPDAPRYVFPGARSRTMPMSNNALRQALRNLGYTNDQQTAHGFRAMARSLLAELGWKPDVIERQLAHKPSGPLGGAYDRALFLSERREMMQAWADYLDSLARGESNVVALKRA